MSSQETLIVIACIAAALFLALLFCIYCLIEAERILNWYIRKYNSEPRVIYPPKRTRLHRYIISFFIRPEQVKWIPNYTNTIPA